jgi:CRP-like cAMP-binding protein
MSEADRESLLRDADPHPLLVRSELYGAGEPIDQVFFPQDGVVSYIVEPEGDHDGGVEYSAVGSEGMVGLPLVLGAESHANARIVTQVPGHALVFQARRFSEHAREGTALHAMLLRYGHYLVGQAAQTAACNRLHSIEQRCAKWLLVIHDRVDGDSFDLADEFLEDMLGVKAAAVSRVISELQEESLIQRAGPVTLEILDREGLEALTCDCYRVVTDSYEEVSA